MGARLLGYGGPIAQEPVADWAVAAPSPRRLKTSGLWRSHSPTGPQRKRSWLSGLWRTHSPRPIKEILGLVVSWAMAGPWPRSL